MPAFEPTPARMRMLVGAMRQGPAAMQRLAMADRHQVVQTVQATGGNAAVQRLLSTAHPSPRSAASPLQRQPGGEPLLRLGSTSPAVLTLQQQLIAAGAKITADGKFGPATHGAVVKFQSQAGLVPDGIVGPKTWTALKSGGAILGPAPAEGKTGGMPPHLVIKLETLKATMQSLHAGNGGGTGVEIASVPEARPITPAVPRLGVLDWVEEQAESASDWAGEQVESATDWAGEQAGAASDWVEEKVDDASTWVDEKVSDAGGWVEEQVDSASDWVEEQVESAGEWVDEKIDAVVETVKDEIKQVGDGLRERFPEEMGLLDQIISDLGRGLDFGDIERQIDKLLANLSGAAGIALDEGETCTPGTTTITPSTKGITVSASNVQDAIDGANAKQGGHVASVLPVFNPLPATFCPPESANKPVQSATVSITETKTVPDWKEKDTKGFEEAKKIWTEFIGVVDAHEEKHIAIDQKHFTDMNKKAEKKPALSVNAAKAELQKVITAADKENAALDAKEGCIKLAGSGKVSQHPRAECGG
jgi:peptidoglycan hydrolase-like protein with peptidoglycan-binding domain